MASFNPDKMTGGELLVWLRENGAGFYQQIVRAKDDDRPLAAFIVIDGEEETAAILKAIEEVSKDW